MPGTRSPNGVGLSDPRCTLPRMLAFYPAPVARAVQLGWTLTSSHRTSREGGRVRGRAYLLTSPGADPRALTYEVNAAGDMYEHATSCRATGPVELLYTDAAVVAVLEAARPAR